MAAVVELFFHCHLDIRNLAMSKIIVYLLLVFWSETNEIICCRSQGDLYRIQGKLETSTTDHERVTLELDKEKLISNKHKEDSKKLLEEFTSLQEMYDKTNMELSKTKDMEIKLKEDYERATYDLEMCRERFDKCQTELRTVRQEKDKAAGECDRLSLDLERAATQHNKAQVGLEKSQEEVARLQVHFHFHNTDN